MMGRKERIKRFWMGLGWVWELTRSLYGSVSVSSPYGTMHGKGCMVGRDGAGVRLGLVCRHDTHCICFVAVIHNDGWHNVCEYDNTE